MSRPTDQPSTLEDMLAGPLAYAMAWDKLRPLCDDEPLRKLIHELDDAVTRKGGAERHAGICEAVKMLIPVLQALVDDRDYG